MSEPKSHLMSSSDGIVPLRRKSMIMDWVCESCFIRLKAGDGRVIKTFPNYFNQPCHYCDQVGRFAMVGIPDRLPKGSLENLSIEIDPSLPDDQIIVKSGDEQVKIINIGQS